VAAKYCFVRILRNTRHLQENTAIHWGTWLGLTFGLASFSFILAEAIPIFNYLIALTGSLCFAPLAIALPGWLWIHDHRLWRRGSLLQQVTFWLHAFLIPLGLFMCVGGTYGVVLVIKEAYASGLIGIIIRIHVKNIKITAKQFSCRRSIFLRRQFRFHLSDVKNYPRDTYMAPDELHNTHGCLMIFRL